MAKSPQKKSTSGSKVKSLPSRTLSTKQAKGVKGGLLPAVSPAQWKLADGSVRVGVKTINFEKI